MDVINFKYKTDFRIGYFIPKLTQDLALFEEYGASTIRGEGFQDGADCLYTVETDAETDNRESFQPTASNPYLDEHRNCVDVLHLAIDYVNRQPVTVSLSQRPVTKNFSHSYYDELNRERIAKGDVIISGLVASCRASVSFRGTGSIDQMTKSIRYTIKALQSESHKKVLQYFRYGLLSLTDPYKEWYVIIDKFKKARIGRFKLLSLVPEIDSDFLGGITQAYRHDEGNDSAKQAQRKWAKELLPENTKTTRLLYIDHLVKAIDFYFENVP